MLDPIQRLNTALDGRYRIERELGQGGMATVYLADDVKHERKVALKVLKPELAAVVGAARFLSEIKTTANLQHPHILPLFDSGEADSFLFYVMPYVAGESLRQRLDREHQLAVDDAVRIATNVAEALDYAHRQGVIHRDIKPANVLLQDGKPVISDFGIALAVSAGGGGRLTETGLSLGTPHYMSPEQATGDLNVGPPTDIYALGCVLYEMLIGEPPYTGSTPQAILGRIIAGELASAISQRPSVPKNVDAAIRKALEKVPADRFGGAAQFSTALSDPAFERGGDRQRGKREYASGRLRDAVFVACGAVAAGLALTVFQATRDRPAAWSTDAAVGSRLTNYGGGEQWGTLAPDGRQFAFVSNHEGAPDIYVRQIAGGDLVPLTSDAAAERALAYTPGGEALYFTREDSEGTSTWRIPALGGQAQRILPDGSNAVPSPDGRELAYYVRDAEGARSIEVASLDGSRTRTLVRDLPTARSLAWSPNGRFLAYQRSFLRAPVNVNVVDLASGASRQVTHFTGAGEGVNEFDWLPDSRHLVVSYTPPGTAAGQDDLGILDAETGSVTRQTIYVDQRITSVSASADGSRVIATFGRTLRSIWRVPNGPDPRGNGRAATRLLDEAHAPFFSFVSRDGRTLLYNNLSTPGGSLWLVGLVDGGEPRQITALPEHVVSHSALSPDGSRVAFVASYEGTTDIWIQNVDGSTPSRFTEDVATEGWPVWSPGGDRIAFAKSGEGGWETWLGSVDGAGAEKLRDGFFRGDWIERSDGNGTWLVSSGPDRTYLMDVEERAVLWELESELGMPQFHPSGRTISAIDQDDIGRSAIWILDAETGERRLAVQFDEPFRMGFRAAWTESGDAFIVSRRQETSQIVLFDDFWISEERQ